MVVTAAMTPPVLGHRSAPLDVAALDLRTVAELAVARRAPRGGRGLRRLLEMSRRRGRAFLTQLRQAIARDSAL